MSYLWRNLSSHPPINQQHFSQALQRLHLTKYQMECEDCVYKCGIAYSSRCSQRNKVEPPISAMTPVEKLRPRRGRPPTSKPEAEEPVSVQSLLQSSEVQTEYPAKQDGPSSSEVNEFPSFDLADVSLSDLLSQHLRFPMNQGCPHFNDETNLTYLSSNFSWMIDDRLIHTIDHPGI